jgi:hypothetical protein
MSLADDHVDDQPIVVITEVAPTDVERPPDAAICPVAGDQIVGLERRCGAPVDSVKGESDPVTPLFEALQRMPHPARYPRMCEGFPTEMRVELRLMKEGHRGPSVGTKIRHRRAEEPFASGVREARTPVGTCGLEQRGHRLAPAMSMEGPHDLAVDPDSAGKREDFRVALDHRHLEPRVGEQDGRGRAHRPEPHDGYVEAFPGRTHA